MSVKNRDSVALDTNILVYALFDGSPHYKAAFAFLSSGLKGEIKLCVAPNIIAEFYSVITNPSRVAEPLPVEEAALRALFLQKSRKIKKLYPSRSTIKRCLQFCQKYKLHGAQIFDAFYAALLKQHNVTTIATFNRKDFAHFSEWLAVKTPSAAAGSG